MAFEPPLQDEKNGRPNETDRSVLLITLLPRRIVMSTFNTVWEQIDAGERVLPLRRPATSRPTAPPTGAGWRWRAVSPTWRRWFQLAVTAPECSRLRWVEQVLPSLSAARRAAVLRRPAGPAGPLL